MEFLQRKVPTEFTYHSQQILPKCRCSDQALRTGLNLRSLLISTLRYGANNFMEKINLLHNSILYLITLLQARDAGPGDLYVGILDDNGVPINYELSDNGDGTYTVDYSPPKPGNYKVNQIYERGRGISYKIFKYALIFL